MKDTQPLRILLVEDSKYNCLIFKKYLAETPHQVDVAENGQVAVEKFKSGNYSLVFMDMEMPVMNGYDATREIRNWEKEKGMTATPVIALTSSTSDNEIKKIMDAGCAKHLAKPVAKEKLLEILPASETLAVSQTKPAHEEEGTEKYVAYVDSDLKDLIPGFLENMEEEINSMDVKWDALLSSYTEEMFKTLAGKAHKLAGSSGSFGFIDVSKASRSMEILMKSILETGKHPSDLQKQQISAYIEVIRKASCATLRYEGAESAPIEAEPVQETVVKDAPQTTEENRLIFVVDDDINSARSLAHQIECFGYTPVIFTELSGLKEVASRTLPSAIIMDIVFPEDDLAGTKILKNIQSAVEKPIPVIFMSGRTDMIARLEAVRAGGDVYFKKPVNVSELVDRLDRMTLFKKPEPYRILIVDDDVSLSKQYEHILKQAGMLSEIVNAPIRVMQPLQEFRPDLILMDIYMPDCNGMELAKVIRQEETSVSIPIVFLSVETNLSKQLHAMRQGGDDFLMKPVKPEHLVSVVEMRAERARVLRSLMKHDGLTGLYNHTTTSELLDLEVERAKRNKGNLAFAMIDLDNFKKVNDSYGHPAGDSVLKSMSRLLKKRLRKTDTIGRYGGEEFSTILLDTERENAFKVLDEIRASFAQLIHHAGNVEFKVTFSSGIAMFPHFTDTAALTEAADKALYEAKKSGRNRVLVANGKT